ncbi:sigma-70 family RNA polymerase sigma factor [Jiangella aurantiaca]|uniref:Sigma-70 family RNA polymerase sigma factor n=1 Tax=Jiangella aurantiaca TaxID=2530373 RepID=A0A4V6PEC6_9ACTN|nr:sigma-70 family RNA polymerase sigma factor [Jiangella aurantiaca]TDD64607.1 sigma-70 family RNA polymerase sigma factor [Jiangella aurantiaca]
MRSPARYSRNGEDPRRRGAASDAEDAVATLYRRFAAQTRDVALGIVDDVDDAEDVVQEAFCAVLGAMRAGRGPLDSAAGYLYTVAKHAAYRHRSIRQSAIAVGVPVPPPDDAGHAGSEDICLDVAAALAGLPLRSRAVLWLIDVEGYRPADLAPALAMTPNAVSSLATRARRSFRTAYLNPHAPRRRQRRSTLGSPRSGVHAPAGGV